MFVWRRVLIQVHKLLRLISCSGFQTKIEGLPVQQHPEFCTLLTGVFNLRPPQLRYSSIWDVQIVLGFIKSNWTHNNFPPNKNLILKLTMLLALTSASITLIYAPCPSLKKNLCSISQNC